MQTEIEIKFFVCQPIQQSLTNLLNKLNIISHGQIDLGNVYFDTPSLDLRRLALGLRIRRSDSLAEQTIKSGGQGVGGLHARPEYNAAVSGDLPRLSAFPATLWPSLAVRDQIQAQLVAQFRTDFLRRHWLIACEGAEIELAWDQGEIVGAQGRATINELELELKSGETGPLFRLAQQLAGLGGVRLGSQSKAQRGYGLAGLGKALALLPLPATGQAEVAISQGLQHWQHHEQYWLECQDPAQRQQALLAIGQGVDLIIGGAGPLQPDWLPSLISLGTQLSQWIAEATAPLVASQAPLPALFYQGDYVRLQLAIAAWLHDRQQGAC